MKSTTQFFIPTIIAASILLGLPMISHAAGFSTANVTPSNSNAVTVSFPNSSGSFSEPTWDVTIAAFLDGVQATAASANSAAFPMMEKWSDSSIGGSPEDYTLDPNGTYGGVPYQAVTDPDFQGGTNYTTHQLNTWKQSSAKGGGTVGNGVVAGKNGEACSTGAQFVYNGYTTGTSMAVAEAETPVTGSHATFKDNNQNEFVIIWNSHCLTPSDSTWAPNPGKDATVSSAALTQVSWSPVSDSHGTVTYTYEISNSKTKNSDGSFASPVFQQSGLTTSSIQTPGTPDGVYYWHVKALDSLGNRTAWSPEFKLTVSG